MKMISNSKNKYRAKKVTAGGNVYDSKKEYNRHRELQLLERAGEIGNLRRQVKYTLLPAQRDADTGKVIERAVTYIADFVYTEGGKVVVEDVKGYRAGQAYAVFTIKRKLMLWVHGIKVREV